MYCIKCGAKSSDEFNYCSNCGAKLIREIDVSDFNMPVEKNWNEITYSKDNSVSFENQAYQKDVYTNCGLESYNPQMITDEDLKYSRMSVAGFILACCAYLAKEVGILCAILGFIFSVIGLVSKDKIRKRGKGFAIAGITLSCVYLLFIAFCFLILLIMYAVGYF